MTLTIHDEESRSLPELYAAAQSEGGTLTVYAGGDFAAQQDGTAARPSFRDGIAIGRACQAFDRERIAQSFARLRPQRVEFAKPRVAPALAPGIELRDRQAPEEAQPPQLTRPARIGRGLIAFGHPPPDGPRAPRQARTPEGEDAAQPRLPARKDPP